MDFEYLKSNYYSQRPQGIEIDTLVLHSMHHPFADDPFAPSACKTILDDHRVSAHYLIDRNGKGWQLVDTEKKALHAGISRMETDNRTNVNLFSIGIELIATETSGYTEPQYDTLTRLTLDLVSQYPIGHIVGHCHIAPDRKTDPWRFDWSDFQKRICASVDCSQIEFPFSERFFKADPP